MRFCWNCGSQVEDSLKFCDKCGANMAAASQPPAGQPAPLPAYTPKHEQPANVAPITHPREELRAKAPKSSGSGSNVLMYSITAVLVVALIALGIFYGQGVGKLNKANTHVTELTASVTSLESQLATEKTNVAGLQTQLAAEKANVANLQTQLATAQSDLTASQAKVTSLTSDLATANAKVNSLTTDLSTANANVTSLTASLATANAKVTTTQASLDKANSDLAAAVVTNTTQAASLKKVQDPTLFSTIAELTAWLAQDDTNTNPAYAALSGPTKAYILQIKALRAGYLISAFLDWDSTYYYFGATTMVGGTIVFISVTTDTITTSPFTVPNAPTGHPLPMP